MEIVTFAGWTSVPGHLRERVWTRVVWAPHFKRFLDVVVIERLDRRGHVLAHVVLCSTDTAMPAEQLRSSRALENHWSAAFFALSLGRGGSAIVFSSGHLKRRAFNQFLVWRILGDLGLQQRFAILRQNPTGTLDLGVD